MLLRERAHPLSVREDWEGEGGVVPALPGSLQGESGAKESLGCPGDQSW